MVLSVLLSTLALAALGVLAASLLVFGAAVLVSELAWAVKHRDWPRPLATLIGLVVLGLGAAGLGWLLQGRA